MFWSFWWINSFQSFIVWGYSWVSSINKSLLGWIDWSIVGWWIDNFLSFIVWSHSWVSSLDELKCTWFSGIDGLVIIHINIIWINGTFLSLIKISIEIASYLR